MRTHRRLWDTYRFPGFRPIPTVQSLFGDPKARVVRLRDEGKTACGACGHSQRGWYDRKTRRVRDFPCGDTLIYLKLEIRRVQCEYCGTVKQEKLDWLAAHPFYTTRVAFVV